MPLLLNHPQKTVDEIVIFLRSTFAQTGKKAGVIAVSGGIDSSLSLSLLARALPKEQIIPVLLPYRRQNMDDAHTICVWNDIPKSQWREINIGPIVDALCRVLRVPRNDTIRKGNIMARVRMILLFDIAKASDGLVCGTENKSEHHLGYFTRFGDAASDIEPITHLYKTQVRQLAEHLGIPHQIVTKHPSAGLWDGQTDEDEFGFTYEEADKVLEQVIEQKKRFNEENAVFKKMREQQFKLHVPYIIHKQPR